MNLMLLACAAILLLCGLIGYKRGLIKSAVSAVGIVGAILIANLINPYVKTVLCEHTQVREIVRQKIEENLNTNFEQKMDSVYEKEDYLEQTDLPEIVKNYIRSNADINKKQVDLSGYINSITDYLTDMVMNGISYVTTAAVLLLIVIIALALSEILSGVPIVGGLDKAGGLIFGLVQAFVIIWLLMLVVTFMSAFDWGAQMMDVIQKSDVLSSLYNKNIFLKIVIDILGDI